MNENFLSQEEIDALLGKKSEVDECVIGDVEKDIIGEVGNISMSTAATTLSSILNHKVLITTPRVSCVSFKQIIEECNIPKVVATVEFKEGLTGENLMMMDVPDATVIADLMMGGDGKESRELGELELSAVSEAMNQMIGSASTAMATMLRKKIDILPPDVMLWDDVDNIEFDRIDMDENICKIAFKLEVEGLIESEIMQIFTLKTVSVVSNIMMGDVGISSEQVEEEYIPDLVDEPAAETLVEEVHQQIFEQQKPFQTSNEKVVVQKPVFENLNPNGEARKPPRNLDLILDVPLEFSVVLGKTKKTIKDILSFGNGSVVELQKLADEPLEIYVNGKLIAHGEVVIINENFGIRITNILSKKQRVENLQ